MTEQEIIATCESRGLALCLADEAGLAFYAAVDAPDFLLIQHSKTEFIVRYVIAAGKKHAGWEAIMRELDLHSAVNLVLRKYWEFRTAPAPANFIAEMEK